MDNELSALSIIFTEFYYWATVVLMFLIHVGFCLYEVGVSRHKNKLNTLMKNAMLIPVITVSGLVPEPTSAILLALGLLTLLGSGRRSNR